MLKTYFCNVLLSQLGKRAVLAGLVCALLAFTSINAFAENVTLKADPNKVPEALKDVGVAEHLGSVLNFDGLNFKDETGADVPLKQYFNSTKPVILSLVYFECPMLCTLVLNGILEGARGMDWTLGQQFQVVSVSIDPKDTPNLAAQKKQAYMSEYGRAGGANGWHFLTGKQAAITNLTNQLGFLYKYDEKQKQFAHPGVIFILTPDGKISRYMYGIQYFSRDLKLALLEATQGRVGNVVDRFLMFCYHYDPSKKGYVIYAVRVMQLGALFTLLAFAAFLTPFWLRQRKRKELTT